MAAAGEPTGRASEAVEALAKVLPSPLQREMAVAVLDSGVVVPAAALEEAEAAQTRRIAVFLRERAVSLAADDGVSAVRTAADLIERTFLARVSSEGVSSGPDGTDGSERNER